MNRTTLVGRHDVNSALECINMSCKTIILRHIDQAALCTYMIVRIDEWYQKNTNGTKHRQRYCFYVAFPHLTLLIFSDSKQVRRSQNVFILRRFVSHYLMLKYNSSRSIVVLNENIIIIDYKSIRVIT